MSARVLFYGLQASGASLVAVLAGQGPDTLAVVDLWNPEKAPRLDYEGPQVLKSTVGPVDPETQAERFGATSRVLVTRHPVDLISALDAESFRDYALPLEAKLASFDATLAGHHGHFELTVRFEQLLAEPESVAEMLRALGLPLPADAHRLVRSPEEIVAFARSRSRWCDREWRKRWGTGRVHAGRLDRLEPIAPPRHDAAADIARAHCPRLLKMYR